LLTVWLLICGHSLFFAVACPWVSIEICFSFSFLHSLWSGRKRLLHPNMPLIIGVLGKNPFGDFLEQAVADEKSGYPARGGEVLQEPGRNSRLSYPVS